MKRTETTSSAIIKSGRLIWETKHYNVDKSKWTQSGTYISPRGLCLVDTWALLTIIRTAIDGQEHVLRIDGFITPRSISMRCCKFLKELKQKQGYCPPHPK